MGVAPFKWPTDRKWEPGIYDKRSNLGMWFIITLYGGIMLTVTWVVGIDRMVEESLPFMLFLWFPFFALVAYFVAGQLSKRDVQVEEIKYVNVRPERMSDLVLGMLEGHGTRFDRDGPRRPKEDYWKDTFHVSGTSPRGLDLVVERNPLIARVDLASVTVRGPSSAMGEIETLKERVDRVVLREMIDAYGDKRRMDKPELVVYGKEGDGGPDRPGPHKPYEPRGP